MGVDIHIHLINKETGDIAIKDIYDGRCSAWFNNISGRNVNNEAYNHLPIRYGLPKDMLIPERVMSAYQSKDYFDFRWIPLKEYLYWFDFHLPSFDAGYLTAYDEWCVKRHGKKFDADEILHYLPAEEGDWRFVENIPVHCPDSAIQDKCRKYLQDICADADNYIIVFYFDN